MNDRLATERTLAAWFSLEDPGRAPEDLSDTIIRTTARMAPRPRWLAGLIGHHVAPIDSADRGAVTRRSALAVAVAALLAILAGAVFVGSGSQGPTQDPAVVVPVVAPSRSASPGDRDVISPATCISAMATVLQPGFASLGDESSVSVTYIVPEGLSLEALGDNGYISFREADAATSPTRGVEVSDVSHAVLHGSLVDRPFLGTDAASFLEDLRDTSEFTVTELTPARLGVDLEAVRADVSAEHLPADVWSHIDRLYGGERVCALEFAMPSRVTVADVGDATIAVQVWATTRPELEAWLPTAMSLIDSFRFQKAP
jgi:hypothetical protein